MAEIRASTEKILILRAGRNIMVTLQISEPCDAEMIKEFDSYIPAERLREKLERSKRRRLHGGRPALGVSLGLHTLSLFSARQAGAPRARIRGGGAAAVGGKDGCGGLRRGALLHPDRRRRAAFLQEDGLPRDGGSFHSLRRFRAADGDFIHQAARRGARGRLRRRAVQKPTIF